MAIKKAQYVLNAGGATFSVKLPTYYSDIDTFLGITEATEAQIKTAFPATVSQLKRAGAVMEFTVTCKVGAKTRRTKLICDIDSAVGAMSGVEGKQFGTGLKGEKQNITNAYFAGRDRFR